MTSVAVTARFNESKHEMNVDVTATGVTIPAIESTRMGIMFKEFDQVDQDTINQVTFITGIDRLLARAMDYNLLDRIQDGTYPDGVRIFGPLSVTSFDELTVEEGSFDWWGAVEDGDVCLQIPGQAGWSRDAASTLYLMNIGKRMMEKLAEDFLKAI